MCYDHDLSSEEEPHSRSCSGKSRCNPTFVPFHILEEAQSQNKENNSRPSEIPTASSNKRPLDSSRNSSSDKKRKSLIGLRESQDEFVIDDDTSTKTIRARRPRLCNTASKDDDHECDPPPRLLPRTNRSSRKVYTDQYSFLEEDSKASDEDEGVDDSEDECENDLVEDHDEDGGFDYNSDDEVSIHEDDTNHMNHDAEGLWKDLSPSELPTTTKEGASLIEKSRMEMLDLDPRNSQKLKSNFLKWAEAKHHELDKMSKDEKIQACTDQLQEIQESLAKDTHPGFKPEWTMDECIADEIMPKLIEDMWKTGSLDDIHSMEADTLKTTMKIVHNIVDCRLLILILTGEISIKQEKNGHIGMWIDLPRKLLRWYCIGAMRKLGKTSRVDTIKIHDDYNYSVDLTNGDVVRQKKDGSKRVLLQHSNGDDARYTIQVRSASEKYYGLSVHHAIIYAFDPNGNQFDFANRLTAYAGYCLKSQYLEKGRTRFSRPNCNLDQDTQDTVGSACKTDIDHCMGRLFNCIFCLWRCHHSVNQDFHQIRMVVGKWVHPQVPNETYAADKVARIVPSWNNKLQPSLTQRVRASMTRCEVEGCQNRSVQGDDCCRSHGGKRQPRFCQVEGCTNQIQRDGVCISHGAKVKQCEVQGCNKNIIQGGVCVSHGARRRRCQVQGCNKHIIKGGVCISHGAKVKRCEVQGCNKRIVNNGVCVSHGANVRRCQVEGCTNQIQRDGVCVSHGAEIRRCQVKGCTKNARKGGVCQSHGAKVKQCKVEGCTKQGRKKGLCFRHRNIII